MGIPKNTEIIRNTIDTAAKKSGRTIDDIKIIAVTKTVDADTAALLLKENITDFGENREQVFRPKFQTLSQENISWHFIGNLQTNKIRLLADKISVFHAITSQAQIDEIEKRISCPVTLLIEVNTANEDSKQGITCPDSVKLLADYAQGKKNIILGGFMTMAPYTSDEKILRSAFEKLRIIRDSLVRLHPSAKELSMGMSNDYHIAVEEGATMVRIGSAFFE